MVAKKPTKKTKKPVKKPAAKAKPAAKKKAKRREYETVVIRTRGTKLTIGRGAAKEKPKKKSPPPKKAPKPKVRLVPPEEIDLSAKGLLSSNYVEPDGTKVVVIPSIVVEKQVPGVIKTVVLEVDEPELPDLSADIPTEQEEQEEEEDQVAEANTEAEPWPKAQKGDGGNYRRLRKYSVIRLRGMSEGPEAVTRIRVAIGSMVGEGGVVDDETPLAAWELFDYLDTLETHKPGWRVAAEAAAAEAALVEAPPPVEDALSVAQRAASGALVRAADKAAPVAVKPAPRVFKLPIRRL